MTKINIDIKAVRHLLELDPYYRDSLKNKSPFWTVAFTVSGFGDDFPSIECQEAKWLMSLIDGPLVQRIKWKFQTDSDGGTWLGDTSHLLNSYSAWQSHGSGFMAATGHNCVIKVGTTADHAKRLADIHWAMKAIGTLSDEFIEAQLLMVAEGKGVNYASS